MTTCERRRPSGLVPSSGSGMTGARSPYGGSSTTVGCSKRGTARVLWTYEGSKVNGDACGRMGRMAVSISLVTPSYNQAKFLDETLRSVVSQRDQLHEYFVFDGGSTDGSVELIRKYA